MKKQITIDELLAENERLAFQLEEAEQLIDAIKAGEVDAFAVKRDDKPEIFTIESGDFGYRLLVENFNEGAVTLSDDGLIVYTNNYFHELLGLQYSQVIGKPIAAFIEADSLELFNELFEKGLTGQVKGEICLVSPERGIPVYISLTALHPSQHTVGMVVTDQTERKIFEVQIKEKAEQLEAKNKELEKMNKELESFAYISSHDLQEPLRKIQTFVTYLNEKEAINLSSKARDIFTRMQSAANRMQTLIDDLLAYSRSNANAAHQKFETVDLDIIIDEVREDLKEEIIATNASIISEKLCTAEIIPFQFRQMMHNLVGNSLKFAKPGVPPRITIKTDEVKNCSFLDGKKGCHISVTDNGIGFDQKYSDKIFQVFQRLHSKDEFEGTGIGLSIVKRIVENHKGVITVHSELGKGTRFDIYIPS
ncbi:sensor histidine kinase [Flavobacterium wongokense]|uniref:sensor histidine kinase n=1 Tax=Flavobacterium wongokense TaxID=2910674 RepID=UPI001F33F37B|nr:ATP-binding protein [Flavobacterium sp. WG47]MCF6131684.1 ATP-binding protein [Flavobacterium sp. WG47]